MSRSLTVLPALSLLLISQGCGSRAYTIPPSEAHRASLALLRGEQATVIALDEEGLAVPIEVEPDDQLEVSRSPGGGDGGGWLGAGQLALVDGSVDHLTLYHRNPGPTLLGIGGGLLGGGWVVTLAVAIEGGNAAFAVPLVGPVLMMDHEASKKAACEAEGGWLCGLNDIGVGMSVLVLLVQVAGAGMLLAGGLSWDPGREIEIRDGDGETALSFGLQPTVLGDGGVGGLLTGRF